MSKKIELLFKDIPRNTESEIDVMIGTDDVILLGNGITKDVCFINNASKRLK